MAYLITVTISGQSIGYKRSQAHWLYTEHRRKLKLVDINNNQVHTAFSRTLGVNEFDIIENADGTTGIEARLGFSKEKINDIESFIKNNTSDIEPIQTLQNS